LVEQSDPYAETEPAFNVGKWGIEMNGLDEGQKERSAEP
jgi:hypothetical protein